MGYTKQNFKNGQTLDAEHLIKIEDGILDCESAIANISTSGGNSGSGSQETSNDCHIIYLTSDTSNMLNLRDLASGTYVLYGKFRPYAGSTATVTFASDLLVNIITKTAGTHVQVFYPVNNCVQFLNITDSSYERTNVYLNDLVTHVGTLSDLTTEEKTSLVGAINELAQKSATPVVDGFSPIATVKTVTEGAKITITDKNGTTTATVTNGKDGVTPVKGTDYYTDADKVEFEAYIASELAKRGQLKPEFANTVGECTDTTKLYVLPDGYIYAYMYQDGGAAYTNVAGNVQENTRLKSSGVAASADECITTGFIPVKSGDIVRIKGFNPNASPTSYALVCFYTDANEGSVVNTGTDTDVYARADNTDIVSYDEAEGVYKYTAFTHTSTAQHPLSSSITHIRINGTMTGPGSDVVVTVNEPIVEATAGYAWTNTGHAFVPADYEGRIVALESAVDELHESTKDVQSTKPWIGKKWVVVGDSLTQAITSDGTNANTDKYYHTHIAEETGITVVNMGQGGTGYKKTDDSGNAFYQRIVNVPTDVDVITIMGSINDLSRTASYDLGNPTDTGTDTVCGCINKTLDELFNVFPLANVGIISPLPTKVYTSFVTEEDGDWYRIVRYCDNLMEICRRRSIPVLDLYHGSGLRPWDKNFRDALYTKDDVDGDGELGGVHLDENGHKIIATKIKAFLETLLM